MFAGKAAPGYTMAKLHIRLINDVAAVINTDPAIQGQAGGGLRPQLRRVAGAAIIPAADLSVQISTAGKEASGTSNMKFALNGALTIGTLDGANVEIRDAVGHDNFFLFGLTADEVVATARARGYDPRAAIARSPMLEEALGLLASGFFSLGERNRYRPIVDDLRCRRPVHGVRRLRRLPGLRGARRRRLHRPARLVAPRPLNIAGASRFSSDATIRQYAAEIWNLKPVKTDFALLEKEP